MDILGYGGSEIIVILVLAGIVLGPERIVRAARELGKLVRNVKAYFAALNEELQNELDVMDELKKTEQELKKGL